ncbi:amino acid permease-domain-containing protein [Aspergillus aurantiobrunneus]
MDSADLTLEHLGYKQEFQRSFGLLDMVGFSFSIVTCWTALSGVFIIGVTAGGPPVIIFGWVGVCVVTLSVAISMAEMCSCWPVAGGQYSWVALLAPPKVSRQLSYITGWFMLTGILAIGSVNNSVSANFIFGQANLVFPEFVIQRWHTVLVTYAVATWALLINAMIMSVGMGAVTGFIFLLTLCFCIGDIDSTAGSSTGVPVIQIFYDSTRSKIGTCFMASMMTVIVLFCSVSLLAEGSRSVFAFACDNGLPFSTVLSKVISKRHIPLNAIIAAIFVQVAFNSIYFGTVTGFNTIISIATTGFYISYALPLFARLLGYASGNRTSTFRGSFSLRLPLSLSLNAVGLLSLLFAFVTFNFPSQAPVDDENMNYTSAAIGVIGLVGIVTWFITAHRRFTGPLDGVHVVTPSSESNVDGVCGELDPAKVRG